MKKSKESIQASHTKKAKKHTAAIVINFYFLSFLLNTHTKHARAKTRKKKL